MTDIYFMPQKGLDPIRGCATGCDIYRILTMTIHMEVLSLKILMEKKKKKEEESEVGRAASFTLSPL